MSGFRALSPNINVNTESGQLRTELQNTFARLDGNLQLAPYRVATQVGPVGSATGETDLLSTNVTVGTLAKQNSSILIFACGTTAANANNKTIKLKFGSTTLFDTGAFAGNNLSWTMQAELVRNGASAEVYWVQFFTSSGLANSVRVDTASESLASNQTLKITGTGTAGSDVAATYWKCILLT